MFAVPTAAVVAAVPTLVQHHSSSANPAGVGSSFGKNYKIPLSAGPVGVGNCLILGITYPHGSDPTSVADNINGTWPAASVTVDAGVGAYVQKIYVFPNAGAGQTTITVSQAADTVPFQYEVSEFRNIAIVSPVNNTKGTASQVGAVISTGSFTPTINNNAAGGNLIWNYYGLAAAASGNPTKWVSGGSFTLLSADIAWITNQGVSHACQYWVQATQAAVNPSITATGDTTDSYNCAAIALKAATAGTAPAAGIRIVRTLHQSMTSAFPAAWKIQMPSSGNLLVLTCANPATTWAPSSITDSKDNVWQKQQPAADQPQLWYAANATPSADLLLTINLLVGSAQATVVLYDISGAAASPFDVAVGKSSTDCSQAGGTLTITSAPTIQPTTTNGLIIALGALGQGPGLAVSSPASAVFDLCTYTGEVDAEFMENADLKGHLYNSTTLSEDWQWLITGIASNSYAALAVAFKGA